jgi:site-specific recombinase XerD
MKSFQQLLSGFLLEYVPRRRNLSPNTVKSYRDSFVLLLEWFASEVDIAPDSVSINDLSRGRIEAFCGWLRETRGVCPATVNVRLSALRSFADYVSFTEPAHLEWASSIKGIRFAKSTSKEVEFLSPDAVGAIIGSAKGDAREHALLSLLYDSGARVSEISSALRRDVRVEAPTTIRLLGKGRKVRIVPLCKQVSEILGRYMNLYEGSSDDPLFMNRFGDPLGRAGIAWILSKHTKSARDANPELVPSGIHPHMLRHSKAVHLLESGINLIHIRDLLGHSSVTTTEVYARASTKAKRKAIEKVATNVIVESAYSEKERSSLLEWLKGLM